MSDYSQGSVIYGLRSQRYPNIKNYGVIITARCEIAQSKAKVIHILSEIELKDWILEELFPRASFKHLETQILAPINEWAKNIGLDIPTLLEFGPEKVAVNIRADANLSSAKRRKLEETLQKWEEWNISMIACDVHMKKTLLDGILKKKKAGILSDLLSGRFPNEFCFLPDCSRHNDGSKLDGLVVQLKDIIPVNPEEIDNIFKEGLDYTEICKTPDGKERLRELNKRYFLSTPDDFVIEMEPISSPWIEFLMQCFSNSFVRIGVDGASQKEITDFCETHKMN